MMANEAASRATEALSGSERLETIVEEKPIATSQQLEAVLERLDQVEASITTLDAKVAATEAKVGDVGEKVSAAVAAAAAAELEASAAVAAAAAAPPPAAELADVPQVLNERLTTIEAEAGEAQEGVSQFLCSLLLEYRQSLPCLIYNNLSSSLQR